MKLLIRTATACIFAASLASGQEGLPVQGAWNCVNMEFSLSDTQYNGTPVESIERITEDGFGVTLKDGYRFALFDVTERTLTWHSPESGDTFSCIRKDAG